MIRPLALSLLVFTTLGGWGQTNDPVVWTFGGIATSLPGYAGVHNPGLDATNTSGIPMADQVAYADSKVGFAGNLPPVKSNQVIIGHSQGGLRALATARHLVNQAKALQAANPSLPGPGTYLKGVITINSPVQGYSPLAQGVASIRNTIAAHSATISGGISAVSEAFGTDITSLVADKAGLDATGKAYVKKMLDDQTFLVDNVMGRLLAPGVDSGSSTVPNSALDMGRASSWYQSNVAVAGWYEYRLTGYTTYSYGWITVTIPTFVTIYHPAQGLIPVETKIGYIYGDDHNFDDVVASAITPSGEKNLEIRNSLYIWAGRGGVSLGTSVASIALDAMAVGLDARDTWEESLDNLTFWDDTYHGEYHNQAVHKRDQSGKAQALGSFVTNIDQVLASALGSAEHDGFIPVPDQFDDRIGSGASASLGGTPIDPSILKIRVMSDHLNALYHPGVWGSEGYSSVGFDMGSSRGKVGADGGVRTYLRLLKVSDSTTTVRGDWNSPETP